MKVTIHFKLTSAIVLAIIPLFYLTSHVISQYAGRHLKEELRLRAVSIAATAALKVDAPALTSREEINSTLEQIKIANPGIRRILVVFKPKNTDDWEYIGPAVETSGSLTAILPPALPALDVPLADNEIRRDRQGYWFNAYAALKTATPGQPAIISVEISAENIIRQERFLRNISRLSTLLAILLCVIIGSTLSYNFTQPIMELIKATTRLVSGDFSRPIPIKNKDEIGELTNNFNTMVANLRQRFNELSAIYEVSQGLTTVIDLDKLLNKILDTATTLLNAEHGSIMLIEPGTDNLVVRAARGTNAAAIKSAQRKIGEGISGWVAKENSPLLITAGSSAELPLAFAHKENIKDAICVPLDIQDKVIGVLSVSNKKGEETFNWENLTLLSTLAGNAAVLIENTRLYKKIQDDFINTIYALAEAVDARDIYTRGHSEQVTSNALAIGRKLKLDAKQLQALEVAAILHDIGKIGISDNILLKPDKLTPEEYTKIKMHPQLGIKILQPVNLPQETIDGALYHHERYDGKGYPIGLAGEQIPLFARIIAIADSFEAMTSDRPYSRAMPKPKALQEVLDSAGTQFDPKLAKIFYDLKIAEEEKG